jgi:hypothetical protein
MLSAARPGWSFETVDSTWRWFPGAHPESFADMSDELNEGSRRFALLPSKPRAHGRHSS